MRQFAWTKVLVLILLAVLCAAVSNLAASRERKLPWVGNYSRALETAPASEANAARETPVPAPLAATASPSASAPSVPAAAGSFAPHPDKASVEIGTDDANVLFQQGRLFLDARRTSVYADGHVQGARSFPVWESDIADRVKAFYEEGLDQNAPIVIYCSGGDCEDSHMLAEKLYMVGFNALFVDKDGFPSWQKRGLPVTKGPKP
jgi:rhodanese-related sulfurtransferase